MIILSNLHVDYIIIRRGAPPSPLQVANDTYDFGLAQIIYAHSRYQAVDYANPISHYRDVH